MQQEKKQKQEAINLLKQEIEDLGAINVIIDEKEINKKLGDFFNLLSNKTIEQENIEYIVSAENALDYEKIANRFIEVRNFLSKKNSGTDFINKNFNDDFYIYLSNDLQQKLKNNCQEDNYEQYAIFATNLENAIKNKTVGDLTAKSLIDEGCAEKIIVAKNKNAVSWTTKAWNWITSR